MRRITDVDGIEQPDGTFLHRRTHTPDPMLPVEPSRFQGQVSERNGHSLPSPEDKSPAEAVLGATSNEWPKPSGERLSLELRI